jgi:ferric-dicitrate binding protein FerR (iron transport regulator)
MDQDETSRNNLFARILSGNIDPDDREAVRMRKDKAFHAFRKLWELTGKVRSPEPPQNQWQTLLAKIDESERIAHKPRRFDSRYALKWRSARVAFAFAMLVSAFFVARKFMFDHVEFATAPGETRTVTLPDSSVVHLNVASVLTYSRGNPRQTTLSGEAFFMVNRGDGSFLVTTGDAKVEVLGTEFNMRARDGSVSVVVSHGRVRFARPGDDSGVELEQGMRSVMSQTSGPSQPEPVDPDRYLAWRDGGLEFVRTPVAEVFDELALKYNERLNTEGVPVEGKTLTASFTSEQTVEDVLASICLTFGWESEKRGDEFIISGR